jgi:hypothetical protein
MMTFLVTVEVEQRRFKEGTWQASVRSAGGDRTLGLCLVNPTDASGRPEAGSSESLTTPFFGDAYI